MFSGSLLGLLAWAPVLVMGLIALLVAIGFIWAVLAQWSERRRRRRSRGQPVVLPGHAAPSDSAPWLGRTAAPPGHVNVSTNPAARRQRPPGPPGRA